MFRFHRIYFLLALVIFIVEVCIALFVHDNFIRPYIGDMLVVMLIYFSVRACFTIPVIPLAISVLLFAYSVEILQYFKVVKLLGLQNYKLANVLIGTSFCWEDMIVYTIGILIIVLLDRIKLLPR
ncbi:MAG: DUF2809 domain-containing protein [Bacteroidales bacterium]|nr:DUF2809 domain-containing protein [Bacteroidales bacterium]